MNIKYVIIAGGAFLLTLLSYQVLSGLGIIKGQVKFHKWVGLTLFGVALIHAIVGISYLLK